MTSSMKLLLLIFAFEVAADSAASWTPLDPRWCLLRHTAVAQSAAVTMLSSSPQWVSSAVRVSADPSGTDLRLITTRAVTKGELLLRIGSEHVLSARAAFADSEFGATAAALYAAAHEPPGARGFLSQDAASALREDPERRVAFFAWLHREVFGRTNSSFAPLLRLLPCAAHAAHLPLLWGPEDTEAGLRAPLFGSMLAARLAHKNLTLATLRATFWRGDNVSADVQAREHAWLEAMHDSRSFGAATPADSLKLMPFLDLFNHMDGAPAPFHTLRPFNASVDTADPAWGPTYSVGDSVGDESNAPSHRQTQRMSSYSQVAHASLCEGEEVFSNYDGGGGASGLKGCAAAKLLYYGFAVGADCGTLIASDWAAGCGVAAGETLRSGRRRPPPESLERIIRDIDDLVAGAEPGHPWDIAFFVGDEHGLSSAVHVAQALSHPADATSEDSHAAVAACLADTAAASAERLRNTRAASWAMWETGQRGLTTSNGLAIDAIFAGAIRAAEFLERVAQNVTATHLGLHASVRARKRARRGAPAPAKTEL